jgi:hypothetical protein
MLSLRDVMDFAAMSEDLAAEFTEQASLPDLCAHLAGSRGKIAPDVKTPDAANDTDDL